MYWNFRGVHYQDGTYGLIEAYYGANSEVEVLDGYVASKHLTLAGYISLDDLRDSLRMMLRDLSRLPILEEHELPTCD
jgi:hypothetical protein